MSAAPLSHFWRSTRAVLQRVWAQRTPRERAGLVVACVLVLLALVWQGVWAPAWRTWQDAPAQQARLDQQTQRMLQLQAQAQTLQKPIAMTRNESVQWLEKNLTDLGPGAQIKLQDDRVTLSVAAAPAAALASWLRLARERALALPVQAQLQHSTQDKPVLWRGTLVLRVP